MDELETLSLTSNDLITIEEAGVLLGKSEQAVRRMCRLGLLPATKRGKQWLLRETAVRAAMSNGKAGSSGGSAKGFDLGAAFIDVTKYDLKENSIRAPDVLNYADSIKAKPALLASAAARIDGQESLDLPSTIEVPKSPFFTRTVADLSTTDRVAYQAVVGAIAPEIDRDLEDGVYSARLRFRRPGVARTEPWKAWRIEVLDSVLDGYEYMIVTDITSYFDYIRHQILFAELRLLVGGDEVAKRLKPMLLRWMGGEGTSVCHKVRMPQGFLLTTILGQSTAN